MSKTIKSSARNVLFRLISSYPHELNEVQKNRREINASLATIENIAVSAAFSTAAGVAGLGYILWRLYWRKQGKKLPVSWKQVGTLDELLVYPVKSCRWMEVQEAECTNLGLRVDWLKDRTLMVVDQKSNFITARGYPEMMRVHISFDGPRMTLTHHNKAESLTVNLEETLKNEKFTATIWGTAVEVRDCGREASEWFSKLLKNETDSLRLVMYASDFCRPPPPKSKTTPIYMYKDTGALGDEASYNMLNEASVEDLRHKIGSGTTKQWVRRLRPTFLVKGANALDEDNWQFVKIGDNIFELIKPCTRCAITTIDPETAVKDPKGEPVETLKSYREVTDPALRKAVGTAPRMGIELALRSPPGGRVRIGDPVYVPVLD